MTTKLTNYRYITEAERDAMTQQEFDHFHDEVMRRMEAIKVCMQINTPECMGAAIDISMTLPTYLMLSLWKSWSTRIREIQGKREEKTS